MLKSAINKASKQLEKRDTRNGMRHLKFKMDLK